MSIQHMDNFSIYGGDVALMTEGMYAEADPGTLPVDPDGVSPGNVCKVNSLRKVLSGQQTTLIVNCRVFLSELTDTSLLAFTDDDQLNQLTVSIENTGKMRVDQGTQSAGGPDADTLLLKTNAPVIIAGSWQYAEFKVVNGAGSGSFELRVNGVTVATDSSVSTVAEDVGNQSSYYSQVILRPNAATQGGASGLLSVKDYIILDGTGSRLNDFIGDHEILYLPVDGDDSFNWTPSTGVTGFNLIDETDADDTDYISADATPPAASVFTLTDLDPAITAVSGCMTVVRAFKTDSGDAAFQAAIDSNASLDNGVIHGLGLSAAFYTDISELNPDGGVPWAPATIDVAKLSVNRTS